MAMNDGMLRFWMVWIIPLYFLFFALSNWERTRRVFIAYVGFGLLGLACIGAYFLHEGGLERQREVTRKMIDAKGPKL